MDFEAMNRLYEKGLIFDPRNKTESVIFTEKGLNASEKAFRKLFRD